MGIYINTHTHICMLVHVHARTERWNLFTAVCGGTSRVAQNQNTAIFLNS